MSHPEDPSAKNMSASPPVKCQKTHTDASNGDTVAHDTDDAVISLNQFQLVEILNESPEHKSTFIHAKSANDINPDIPSGTDAVILLERKPLSKADLGTVFATGDGKEKESQLSLTVKNDVYRNMDLTLSPQFNAMKATVICPATKKHIDKFRDQSMIMFSETPGDYKDVTSKFIKNGQFSIEWVYNCLEHKAEADRIVFEDSDPVNGFVILPDLKWDGTTMEMLYCSAIVHRRDVPSLRDLTTEHLPMLRNILHQGTKSIQERYGVKPSELRIYVHYQPTYYHFHVHFTHIKWDAPGTYAGKAILLSDIIDNIARYPDFYQTATLTYTLKAGHALYKMFQEAGRI